MSTELVPSDNRTLYAICDDLQCWFDTLEMVESQLAESLPDEERPGVERQRDEIRTSLDRLGAELSKKTDNVAGVLRRIATEQEMVKTEEQRLHARRKAFERAEEWLRRYVLSVMKQNGIEKLKTPTNTLYIRASDGVVITDAGAVPDSYKTVAVKLPMSAWRIVEDDVRRETDNVRVDESVSLSEIKKVIKGGAEIPGADLEMRDNLVLR